MGDFYLDDPLELRGRPKATIADYVEHNGILVPRRFANLDEALSSGIPIVARSEHLQDYAGASGVLESIVLGKRKGFTEDRMLKSFLRGKNYKKYCALLGIDESEFVSGISASYWEKIDGISLTISADSAISNRYHVIARTPTQIDGMSFYYFCIEDGNVIRREGPKVQLKLDLSQIVNFYEKVRNLDKFDPSHCPIVEAQYNNGQVYFLQYHRGRDLELAQFKLERPKKRKEFEFDFVRGATANSEGSRHDIIVWHRPNPVLNEEDGSHDEPDDKMFTEIMTRKRKIELFNSSRTYGIALHLDAGHVTISRLFKPNISLGITTKKLFELVPVEEYHYLMGKAQKTNMDQKLRFHIISDGRKAYISRV